MGNDTITNTGSIIGGSGTIAGDGVYLYTQSTLTNQGTIIGGYGASFGNGVRVESGNVITNGAATDTSALILGNNGVEIQGTSASSLTNFATITGRNDGVYIQQSASTIINEATGVIVGIIGPNGAGKSTLIKAAMGIITPISGNVQFFAQPLKKLPTRIAYVPQRESVDWDFPITVQDLVLMGRYGKMGIFRWPRREDREAAVCRPSFAQHFYYVEWVPLPSHRRGVEVWAGEQ